MKLIYIFVRIYQFFFAVAARFLSVPRPKVYKGVNAMTEFVDFLATDSPAAGRTFLFVCDPFLYKSGLAEQLTGMLDEKGLQWDVFTDFKQNPDISDVEKGLAEYTANNCGALLAFGGGSSLDCAKGIAARAACPKKTLRQMKGLFKVCGKPRFSRRFRQQPEQVRKLQWRQ